MTTGMQPTRRCGPIMAAAGAIALTMLFSAAGLGQEEESGEEIMARERYFQLRRAGGPGKSIPSGAYERAVQQSRGLRKDASRTADAWTTWANINPTGLFYLRTGANYIAGRTNCIAFHPTDTNTFYTAAAGGGIWKTTDGGANFQPVTDNLGALTSGAVAVDPTNGSIVYVATGELNYSLDSYYGDGIYKSTDGGTSWAKIATTSIGLRFSAICINPLAPSTVYVAGSNGVYKSTNGGGTWAQVNSGSNVNALVMDPGNPQVLYMSRAHPLLVNSINKTTNGGSTWTTLGGGLPGSMGRVALAIAQSNSNVIYASIASKNSPYGLLGLYRSTDAGATWTLQNSGTNYLGSQGWYDNVVTVHPSNADAVVVGGLDIYTSADGGVTLTQRTAWATTSSSNMSHADIHYLGYRNTVLYCGSDGGVYKSTNDGVSWSDLNQTVSTLQCQSADYDPTNTQLVYAGTQDNNKLSTTDGGASWIQRTTGDGGYTVVDPVTTNYVYGQYVNGSLQRSANYGVNYYEISPSGSTGGLFYNPYEMAPGDHNTIVYGQADVWKTTAAQSAETFFGWTQIASTATVGGDVSAIGIGYTSTNVIYIGTSDGRILVTTNNGGSWSVSASGLPYVSDFAVDPASDAVAYATFTGFTGNHLYKTTNYGSSWLNVTGNLPDIPVNSIVLRSIAPRTILLGTDLGVYKSTNDGATWVAFNNGLPAVEVFDLKYRTSTNLLLAATHGRGCYTYDFGALLVPRTLQVNSADPGSGVSMTVTPVDTGGSGSGTTPASRTYFDSMSVTVTAPATHAGSYFSKWLKDGANLTANTATTVIMDTNHTLLAQYASVPTFALTVASLSPASGVSVTLAPPDVLGNGSGATGLVRYFLEGETVTLTAPPTGGANYFQEWRRNGVHYAASLETTVVVNAALTMAAVYAPAPLFSAGAASIAFGPVKALRTKTDSVLITNVGNAAMTVSLAATFPASFSVVPSSANISAAGSAKFKVTYAAPLSNTPVQGSLALTHNGASSPDTVLLSAEPYHIFSPDLTHLDFGDAYVGSTMHDTLMIGVDTALSMDVGAIASSAGAFAVSPVSGLATESEPLIVDVSFTPSSVGAFSGVLMFSHDQAGSPDTVTVAGTGVQSAFSMPSPGVSFGYRQVAVTAVESLAIANPGTGALIIDSATGTNAEFGFAPAPAEVPPSGTLTCYVTFTPSAAGSQSHAVVLWHNGPGSPDTLMLDGIGVGFQTAGVPFQSEWNLISVPYILPDMTAATLFPGAASPAYGYDSGYDAEDTLRWGAGYWLRHTAAETASFFGPFILPETIAVAAGWNLIGVPAYVLPVGQIESAPAGMVTTPVYGYSGSYTPVDSIRPGRGYWIKVSGNGDLIFPAPGGSVLPGSGRRIQIVASDELPPAPPPQEAASGSGGTPVQFALRQNYANPFNPSTIVRYEIPVASRVTITVCDVLGRVVATLVDEMQEPGFRSVTWNAGDVPSGVYFCKLTAGEFTGIRKMLLIR